MIPITFAGNQRFEKLNGLRVARAERVQERHLIPKRTSALVARVERVCLIEDIGNG